MKLSPFISLGEWTPDLSAYGIQGLTVCSGVIPDSGNYKPYPNIVEYSAALTARAQGAYSYLHSDNTTKIFSGDATKLYLQAGIAQTDVSRTTGGAYNCDNEGVWRFKNYGDRIIATDYNDTIQSYVVGTDTDFSELSADAPKAKVIDIVNNFVMVGNTDDPISGKRPERVWWSAIDNPTSWPTAGTVAAREVQSDYQDLVGNGGAVRAIVGAQNYAVIVMDKAIWRGEYVGLPSVFNFNQAEDNRGTKVGTSVISDGRNVYYIDEDGFYVFDGVASTPIGNNKVDDYFKAQLAANYSYRITAAYDPLNQIVMWSYPSVNSGGTPDKIICYHVYNKVWSELSIEIDYLFGSYTTGYTLEDLDAFGTLETITTSFDSIQWMGGKTQLAGFTTDFKLGYFSGDNLEAILTTGELQLNEGGRAFVSSVLPISDAAGVAVDLGTRTLLSGSISYSGESTINSQTGECSFRSESPYHTIKFRIPAGESWNYIKGYKLKVNATGNK